LIDLSRGGAKLLVDACLQLSEAVQLRICILELSLEIDVTAQVCWTRPDDDGRWLVGFSFNPGISDEMLHQLAVHSIVERRRSPRHAVSAKASVTWQSQDQLAEVQLRDISAGGFCMTCEQNVPLGEKLLLRLPMPHGAEETITAQVRWQMTCGQRQLIGCALSSDKDYRRLREAVRHNDVKPGRPRSWRHRCLGLARSRLRWLVAPLLGAIALAIVLSLSGMSSSGGDVHETVPAPAASPETRDLPTPDTAIVPQADSPPEADPVSTETLLQQQRRRWRSLLGETTDDTGAIADGSDSSPSASDPPITGPDDLAPSATNIRLAVDAFARGDRAYRGGRYEESMTAFQEAARHDANNPLYHYLLALAQYQLGQHEEAVRSAETGIALETARPLVNWDRSLARYQDEARGWLEAWRAARTAIPEGQP
jgi:hypothetical protein